MRAAVVGLLDEMLGQVIQAFVVCRVGITASFEELVPFVTKNSALCYMAPKFVEVMSELLTLTSGKVVDPVYVGVKSYEPPPLHGSGL